MEPDSRRTNGPTAIEKRQDLNTYQKLKRTLADIMKEAADVRGQIQSVLKAHDKKGGDSKMVVMMAKLEDMTKGEAEDAVARYFEYARDIGIRVSFYGSGQGSVDEVLGDPAPVRKGNGPEMDLSEARAYDDGCNSARHGALPQDNPFNGGTIEHQGWARGRNDTAEAMIAQNAGVVAARGDEAGAED